jgi:decaprenyl-phosphate phosphoribosyltransferase
MKISPYIQLARPDNWFKNIFMLPGILLAFFFEPALVGPAAFVTVGLGIAAACLIVSSYYVFNEILDAAGDAHHPVKKLRPLPSGRAQFPAAWCLWALLSLAGLGLAFGVNLRFGLTGAALWLMGVLYNLPPIRLKDLPYCDVLSESVNNPLRLLLGWYSTGFTMFPPLSVLLAYWMFGAFLMAAKRFAEFRHISDTGLAARYRRSFGYYTAENLIVSLFFYASLFALMSGYFIARFHFELILATPLVAYAMAYYMHLAYKPNSPVQYPERLFRQKKLVLLVLAAFIAWTLLLFSSLPVFNDLFMPQFPHA